MYKGGDFNYEGSYNAVISTIMNDTSKYRSDYGTFPFRGVIDLEDYEKMRSCDPPLSPYTNYDHLIMILACRLGQELQLHAGAEVSIIFIYVYFFFGLLFYFIY